MRMDSNESTNNTIRGGLPSASSFGIDAICRGRQQLLRSLRESGEALVEQKDPLCERGLRIHKAWETGDVSLLSEDEMVDYTKTVELDAIAVDAWLVEKGAEKTLETSETRLWLKCPETGENLTSGQYDKLTIAGSHAYCRDLKSGWCRNLTPSQESYQLRLLCVLIWLEHGQKNSLETVRASFIKPKSGKFGVDTVEYNVSDLLRANNSVRQILWEIQQPNAQRTPGKHCNFCQARIHCVESAAMSLLPSVMSATTGDVAKKDVVAAVARLSPTDWKYIWQRSSVIRNILDACNAQLKQLPKEQLSEIGLQVGKGKQLDPISNTEGAFKFLEHQLPRGVLWGCMKMNKSDLAEALHAQKGMTKKDAAQWVRDNLAIFIEAKESEGSLEEI